jgi:hypothetical protein
MLKSVNKWVFVITGVLFNISAAIITHYFIGLNDQQIMLLQQKVEQYDTLIQSQWRMKTETDRKQEFMLLLLIQDQPSPKATVSDFILRQLKHALQQQKLPTHELDSLQHPDFAIINRVSEQVKQHIIQSINDSYLQRLEIEKNQQPLEQRNSLLFSVAIFLQLTGLILVLAKDIGK